MNYNHLIETTLELVIWSDESIGLKRHSVYITHSDAIMTIEHKGSLLKYKISIDDANKIIDLIQNLNPCLGNSIQHHRYWMTINSPCLKLEYRWNNPNDLELSNCNELREYIYKLETNYQLSNNL